MMGRAKRMTPDEKASILFDYAAKKPRGFTVSEAVRDLGWERRYLGRVIRHLRMMFAEDEINLTCDPDGYQKEWRYRLVGTYRDAQPWSANRVVDLGTRVRTMHAVASTLVKATDGRTLDGKKARTYEVSLRHLIENIELMDAG